MGGNTFQRDGFVLKEVEGKLPQDAELKSSMEGTYNAPAVWYRGVLTVLIVLATSSFLNWSNRSNIPYSLQPRNEKAWSLWIV